MGKVRNHTRAQKTCEICGAAFSVPNYRRDKARFCGKSCRSSFVARKHFNNGPKPWAAANLDGHRHKSPTRFRAGAKPWNKGLKGIHLSPETEFKPGRESDRKMPTGSITIRDDKHGNPRAWVKTVNGWMPRAQVVYRAKHGEVPEGTVIHHLDGDTLNDRPGNLKALTPSQHIAMHREELRGARDA